MGDVYSVGIKFVPKDEKAITAALRKFIYQKSELEGVDFCLADYSKKGITPDSMDNCIKILITDNGFSSWREGEFVKYYSGFNATYSWGQVLWDGFMIIIPYIKEGSFDVDADETNIHWVVKDGIIVSD